MDKKLYRYGFGVYALLFVIAVLFYKERASFLDAAYLLFHIIKDGTPAIQHYRYGAIVTQVFPLVGCKLSLPLGSIMLIYSSCFVLWQALCYWLCGNVLKQYSLALALLLSNILFVTDSFYWPLSELPQGMALAMVLMAGIMSLEPGKNPPFKYFAIAVIFIACCFFHALLIVPFAYGILFFMLRDSHRIQMRRLVLTLIVFALLFLLKQKYLVAGYEKNAMLGVKQAFNLFPNWINLTTNRIFIEDCMGKFIWIPVSVLAISIVYIHQRNWQHLLFFWGSFVGYLLLVNTAYPHGNTPDFYIENLYYPLGVMLALPLVFDVLPALQGRRLALPLFILIAATALVRIYLAHDIYTSRLNWQRNFMEQHAGEKLLVAATQPMRDTLIMTWATPYEFWLLSTVERDTTASIVITDNIEGIEYTHWERMSFVMQWGVVPYAELSGKYFNLPDTVNRYRVVK